METSPRAVKAKQGIERLFQGVTSSSTLPTGVDLDVHRMSVQTLNHLTDELDGSTSEDFPTRASFHLFSSMKIIK